MNSKNKKYFKSLIIVFAAIIFCFAYYKFVHSKLIEFTNNSVSNRIESVTQIVENFVDSKLNEVKTVSDVNFNYKNDFIDFNKSLPVIKKTLVCENVLICDIDGKSISDSNDIYYFQDYDFFKKACEGISSTSNPVYIPTRGKWFIAAASPIRDIKGNVVRILTVLYNVNEIENIISNIDFGEGTITFITDMDKVIVASNLENLSGNISKDGSISDNTSNFSIIKDMQAKAYKFSYDNDTFYYNEQKIKAFFNPFKNNDWILIFSIPENTLYREVYIFSSIITLFSFIVAVTAVVIVFYSSKISLRLKNEKKKRDFLISSSNIITLKLNSNGAIIDYNDNFSKIVDFENSDSKNRSIYSIIPKDYYNYFDRYFKNIFKNSVNGDSLDMPVINSSGNLSHILWNADIYNKELDYVEFIGTNISKIKDYEIKIQRLAYIDQLTGLKNMAYLEEYFNNIILTNDVFKIAFIDIDVDNFKYINEMFDYSFGDNFIIDISTRILSVNNPKVKVCKRGGDEFVILYENAEDDNELVKYIHQLFKAINSEYYINNVRINLSVSIGVSIYPDNAIDYPEILKCADIALQSAKRDGRNIVRYFNNSMKNELYEIISIESDLKSAVENNEFVLYYQPQYNIKTGQLYGFEALIRWLSPYKGFVSPNKFIPQAEKNQLIIPIGKFAFKSACNFMRTLTDLGFNNLHISVNISIVQMMCDDFVDFIIKTIEETKINPQNIKLEISESVFIKSINEIIRKIEILNDYGIKFLLDDFGTSYSYLSYLSKTSFDFVKINKEFTDAILGENSNSTKDIVSLIINLAKSNNISVAAEGVEVEEQLKWLLDKGCDIAQGFYMGKPMPKDEALEILNKTMHNIN